MELSRQMELYSRVLQKLAEEEATLIGSIGDTEFYRVHYVATLS
jgi:hypothetical protein